MCDTEEADDGTVVETPTLTQEVNDTLSQLASSSKTVGDALPSETLLKHPWAPISADLPSIVLPKSLSLERQWYLYNIYCPDLERDLTCPLPSVFVALQSRLPSLNTIATNST